MYKYIMYNGALLVKLSNIWYHVTQLFDIWMIKTLQKFMPFWKCLQYLVLLVLRSGQISAHTMKMWILQTAANSSSTEICRLQSCCTLLIILLFSFFPIFCCLLLFTYCHCSCCCCCCCCYSTQPSGQEKAIAKGEAIMRSWQEFEDHACIILSRTCTAFRRPFFLHSLVVQDENDQLINWPWCFSCVFLAQFFSHVFCRIHLLLVSFSILADTCTHTHTHTHTHTQSHSRIP